MSIKVCPYDNASTIIQLCYTVDAGGVLKRKRLAYLEENVLFRTVDFIYERGVDDATVYPGER